MELNRLSSRVKRGTLVSAFTIIAAADGRHQDLSPRSG